MALWKRVIVIALFGCSIAASASAQQNMKLGVIGPLTGAVSAWGIDVQRAVQFAEKRFGQGRFEIVFEDDQCQGPKAVTAAQKLIHIDHVDAAMVVCTESMLSAAPLFEQSKTLVITPVATGAAVSQAGDYIFRMWPSDALAAALLVNHLTSKYKRVAMLTEERGYSEELSRAFLSALKGTKLQVVSEHYASDTADFRTLLARLRSKRPDVLFLNSNGEGPFAAMLKQKQDLKWDIPVTGVYMPGSPAFLKLAGPLAEGIEFVDAPSAESAVNESGKKLYDEFVGIYGLPSSSSFVIPATIESFRRIAGLSSDRSGWRSELYRGNFQGVFGAYSFDTHGDIKGVRHVLKKVVDGASIPFHASDGAERSDFGARVPADIPVH